MESGYFTTKIRKTILFTLSVISLVFIQSCRKDSVEITSQESDHKITAPIITTYRDHDLYFDLDEDGKNDYLFKYNSVGIGFNMYDFIYVDSIDSSQVQYSSESGTNPLKDSIQISDTSKWSNSAPLASTDNVFWDGYFVIDNPQNLGLRLNRSGSYNYGWVKLLVKKDGGLNIYDYAFNPIADNPILAGIHP